MLIPLRLFRRRCVLKVLFVCGALWLLIVAYTQTSLDAAVETVWYGILRRSLDHARLRELMMPISSLNGNIVNPLEEMILQKEGMLNYFHLPKRKFGVSFTEITSANPNTSYPLAPDFTFHIEYNDKEVVIYEDYGPGCVFRIYLFPIMPTDTNKLHAKTSTDLRDSYLSMKIDGRTFWFSIQQMMEGLLWPFLFPLNTQHPKPASGMGAYAPFCYEESMKIAYQPYEKLPFGLFDDTVNCTNNDYFCPVHIYSAVSRHKYSVGPSVQSFAALSSLMQLSSKRVMEAAAGLLKQPEIYGPESGERCQLQCMEVCQTCRRMLYKSDKPGVIVAMKMRVYETSTLNLLEDWNQILVTMHWDNTLNPQVDRVPLGSIFGVTGSLNDLKGAALGHRMRTCFFSDSDMKMSKRSVTGYIYFPMPYWKSVEIFVEGAESLETSLLLCFQISLVENIYDSQTTGYFQVAKTYYTEKVDGWRNMLTLDNSWGNIVGLLMEIDNLKARRQVASLERWALLQADMVLFTDGRRAAAMMGTGLEDYFSYAHGFALAENTSYAFVGVHHSAPRRSEPLTWHCYRLHVLDPIPFHSSVTFIMEGTKANYYQQEQEITYEEHWNRKTSGLPALSHTVLFYAKNSAASTTVDVISLADSASEKNHKFNLLHRSEIFSGETFQLNNKRFLGNSFHDERFNTTGRTFKRGDKYSFILNILRPNSGVILRRTFYSPAKEWNEKCHIWVNNQPQGIWFLPMGTLSDEFVLREEDLLIHASVVQESTTINIVIEPLTTWRDISYQAIVMH